MAYSAPYGFRPAPGPNGTPQPVTRKCDTTTAFVAGDPLIIGSTGLELATASSSYIDAIAAVNSTGASDGALLPVYLCGPTDHFYVRADGSSASLDVGSEVDIDGASGAVVADVSASTTNVLILESKLTGDPENVTTAAGHQLLVRMFQRSRT